MPHHWWKTSAATLSAAKKWEVVLETTDGTATKPPTASFTVTFDEKGYFVGHKLKKMKKNQAESLAGALCSALNLLTAPD